MTTQTSTLTERGQVSIPASIRKEMDLRVGQKIHWIRVSADECRIVFDHPAPQGAVSMLGFGAKAAEKHKRTRDWMRELRKGE